MRRLLFLWQRRQIGDRRAWFDVPLFESAKIHLQRVRRWLAIGRTMVVERLGLHVFDVDDLAVGLNEGGNWCQP